jgi:hypothetical protein
MIGCICNVKAIGPKELQVLSGVLANSCQLEILWFGKWLMKSRRSTCGLGFSSVVSPFGPKNRKISGPRPVAVRLYCNIHNSDSVPLFPGEMCKRWKIITQQSPCKSLLVSDHDQLAGCLGRLSLPWASFRLPSRSNQYPPARPSRTLWTSVSSPVKQARWENS